MGKSSAKARKDCDSSMKPRDAPSIIFINEIDSIAPREKRLPVKSKRESSHNFSHLWMGWSPGKVVVIAATNRPNAIDPALQKTREV